PSRVECGSPRKPQAMNALADAVPAERHPDGPHGCGTLSTPAESFMEPDQRAGGRLAFGVFEVDLRAGELRKRGLRVRLQQQPFQVLAILLERAGDVVSREELQQTLWPANTFVDFDHGLNKAINKIREALGDSAETPRFVETIAKRGYRFLADVRVADASPVRSAQLDAPLLSPDWPADTSP